MLSVWLISTLVPPADAVVGHDQGQAPVEPAIQAEGDPAGTGMLDGVGHRFLAMR